MRLCSECGCRLGVGTNYCGGCVDDGTKNPANRWANEMRREGANTDARLCALDIQEWLNAGGETPEMDSLAWELYRELVA
jgi:hypothetical protein